MYNMSESSEGVTSEQANLHDWRAAKEANPERFVTYPVEISHELAGYVNEHLNRVMASEIQNGSRQVERASDDMDDPFERAHKAFSVGYHSNHDRFGTNLSEYQIMGICGLIRQHSQKTDKAPDDVMEAGRKILELKTRFEAALPKKARQNRPVTPAPSLGGVVKRWVDKFSNSKEIPYE